jgi:hypothetical protein
MFKIAINQALGIASCTNSAVQENGQCNVVDVQRVTNASLGGARDLANRERSVRRPRGRSTPTASIGTQQPYASVQDVPISARSHSEGREK